MQYKKSQANTWDFNQKKPPKAFRKFNGELYFEQLFGTVGFDGMSTNSYLEKRPTQVKEIRSQYSIMPKI